MVNHQEGDRRLLQGNPNYTWRFLSATFSLILILSLVCCQCSEGSKSPPPKKGETKLWITWRDNNPTRHIIFKLAIQVQKYHSAICRSLLWLNIIHTVTGFRHCPAQVSPSVPWRVDKEEESPMLWTVSLLRAHADIYPGSCMITTPTAPRDLMLLRAFCAASGLWYLRWRKHITEESYATLLTQAWGVNTAEGGSSRAKSRSSNQANSISN